MLEKLRWENLDVDGVDDQIPKPRAGHSAVSVSNKTVVTECNNQDQCNYRSRYGSFCFKEILPQELDVLSSGYDQVICLYWL